MRQPMNETNHAHLQAQIDELRAQLNRGARLRRTFVALLGAGALLVSGLATAQLVTFAPDQPALASAVNSNFTFLNTAITNSNTAIANLRTLIETKIGSLTVGTLTVSGLTLGGNRISNVGTPATGNAGNADVVTKAHLKAVLDDMVVFVVGNTCPTGFVPYPLAEDRVLRGSANGDESTEGVNSVGVSYSLGNIAALNGGGGGPFLTGLGIGGAGNGGAFNVRPSAVRLKPCKFDPNY